MFRRHSLFCLGALWVSVGNRLPARCTLESPVTVQKTAPASTVYQNTAVVEKNAPEMPTLKKAGRLQQKCRIWYIKKMERLVKQYGQKRGTSEDATIAGLIVLGIILTIGLTIGALLASCNLYCSGNNVAATFVIILGLGAIVALWVLIGKEIKRQQGQRPIQPRKRGVW